MLVTTHAVSLACKQVVTAYNTECQGRAEREAAMIWHDGERTTILFSLLVGM